MPRLPPHPSLAPTSPQPHAAGNRRAGREGWDPAGSRPLWEAGGPGTHPGLAWSGVFSNSSGDTLVVGEDPTAPCPALARVLAARGSLASGVVGRSLGGGRWSGILLGPLFPLEESGVFSLAVGFSSSGLCLPLQPCRCEAFPHPLCYLPPGGRLFLAVLSAPVHPCAPLPWPSWQGDSVPTPPLDQPEAQCSSSRVEKVCLLTHLPHV